MCDWNDGYFGPRFELDFCFDAVLLGIVVSTVFVSSELRDERDRDNNRDKTNGERFDV